MLGKKKDIVTSHYPLAYKPKKVGTYPPLVESSAGYFYNEVLEYRVWIHPEAGGEDLHNGSDYFYSFLAYEEALIFSKKTKGAEKPLVLILQEEHIDEPELNKFVHVKKQRIAEWQVEWLTGNKREKDSIKEFLKLHQRSID